MEAIPKIRRPAGQAHHRPDRGPGTPARLDGGHHHGRPDRRAVRRGDRASPAGRRVALGQAHGRRVVQDAGGRDAGTSTRWTACPYGRYRAMAVAPLTAGRLDPPDICLIYGTPGQMIFFINGLQWIGYKKMSFTSVGESAVRRFLGQGAQDRRARADHPVLRRAALRRGRRRRAADGHPAALPAQGDRGARPRCPGTGCAIRSRPYGIQSDAGAGLRGELLRTRTRNRVLELRGLHAAYGLSRVLHGVSLRAGPGEVVSSSAGTAREVDHAESHRGPGGGRRRRRASRGAVTSPVSPRTRSAVWGGLGAGGPAHLRRPHGGGEPAGGRAVGAALARRAHLSVFPKLGELAGRRAGSLSGGEQQMLTVARTSWATRGWSCSTSLRGPGPGGGTGAGRADRRAQA